MKRNDLLCWTKISVYLNNSLSKLCFPGVLVHCFRKQDGIKKNVVFWYYFLNKPLNAYKDVKVGDFQPEKCNS